MDYAAASVLDLLHHMPQKSVALRPPLPERVLCSMGQMGAEAWLHEAIGGWRSLLDSGAARAVARCTDEDEEEARKACGHHRHYYHYYDYFWDQRFGQHRAFTCAFFVFCWVLIFDGAQKFFTEAGATEVEVQARLGP